MHIGICDDDNQDLSSLVELVQEYDTTDTITVSSFSSANALLHCSEIASIDIAILDIEMEAPNGYEIAIKLINLQNPPIIIFVTNSMEYTMRGYGVAHRYLAKPLVKHLLWEALDTAILKVKANRFAFVIDGCSQITKIEDIYYFEIFNHSAVIHTNKSEYTDARTPLRTLACECSQHEGSVFPCIVRKKPQVPNTARQAASLPRTSREASGVPCLNPRRGLTLLSPVCRDPAIGV